MRKKIQSKLMLALFIPALYILSVTGFNSVSEENFIKATRIPLPNAKDFLNIVFNISYSGAAGYNYLNWVELNLNEYKDSLNYNGIQIYDENSSRFGYLDSALSTSQIENVIGLMSDIGDRELKGFYARTKITKLAEGQRLEYEVSQSGSTTINDGFCYQKVMSNTYTTDTGRTVLHAKTWPADNYNSAGWLCYSIYENMQHSDFINGKDRGNWFVKPMMRIKQSDFNLASTTPVVAIVIKNFDGSRMNRDSIVVRINNFRNENNQYLGQYIDKYNFALGVDSLQKTGDTSSLGLNHGNGGYLESSQVDFKVYWFGQVDVWFDKMTVDDELGNRLFNKDTLTNFDSRIRDEVSNFTNHPSNYTFFCDEVVYSQIPCLEYIKNKMTSFESDAQLSYVMSDGQNRYSLKNDTVAYGPSLRKVEPKVFFADPYMIPWEIPNNISFPGAQQLTPSAYNDTLQRVFGDKSSAINIYEGSFLYQVNLARTKMVMNSPESKFFVIPQISGYMKKDISGNYDSTYGVREPINEEIQAQAMLSIAHGADGLGWFIYQGSEWTESCSSGQYGYIGHNNLLNHSSSSAPLCNFYNYALLNQNISKRRINLFGQNKWDYVSKMNKKILNWKPTLDEITWQNVYSVHNEGANHNFISDIKSIKRNPFTRI